MGTLVDGFEKSLEPYSLRVDLNNARDRIEVLENTLEKYREGMQSQNEVIASLIKLINWKLP